MFKCSEAGCESEYAVYFSAFEGTRCLLDAPYCNDHARMMIDKYWARTNTLPDPKSRLDDAAPFSVDFVVYCPRRLSREHPGSIIRLVEMGGTRYFLLETGPTEAWSIRCALLEPRPPRPTMYHVYLNTVSALGGTVESALVDALDEAADTYHAKLRIRYGGEGLLHSDACPSDAFITAVLAGAPLFVREDVLSKVERHYRRTGHSMRFDSRSTGEK